MSTARAMGAHDLSPYRPPYWCLGEASRHNFGGDLGVGARRLTVDACRWTTVDCELWFCKYCGHVHDEPSMPRALAAVVPMRYSEPPTIIKKGMVVAKTPVRERPPPLRIKITSASGTSTWLEKGTVEGDVPWPTPQPAPFNPATQPPIRLQRLSPPTTPSPKSGEPSFAEIDNGHVGVTV